MRYFSTKTYNDVTFDPATAEMSILLDCYNSLLEQSDCGGAFPGSKAWTKGKKYRDQLAYLVAARPDVETYRSGLIAQKVSDALRGKDVLGL